MKFKQKHQILFLKLKILPLIHFKELSLNHNQPAASGFYIIIFMFIDTKYYFLNSHIKFWQNLRFYSEPQILFKNMDSYYHDLPECSTRIIRMCQPLWHVYTAYVALHTSLGLNIELYKNLRLYSSKPQIKFGIWTFQKSRVGKILITLAFPLPHPAQKMFRTWLGCLKPHITSVKQVP